MYDWQKTLMVTINGQLLLLMLCEKLVKIGVKIDMCNTDGITVLYRKELREKVDQTIKEWEQVTKMEMESVFYNRVYRANINNYLAIDINGKTKEKGYFISKPLDDPFLELSGSHDFMIISKAIVAYFKDGIDYEKFIKEHTDIYNFCASYKCDSKFTVTWNGKIAQRLNRFYVSQRGAFLYKTKPESKEPENMLKGWAVQLANKVEDENALNHDIDYRYYISEVRKIINEFESNQEKLL